MPKKTVFWTDFPRKFSALALSVSLLPFPRFAAAQVEIAGRDAGVATIPAGAAGVPAWQNFLAGSPQVFSGNLNAAQIGPLSRILSQSPALSPADFTPSAAKPGSNWKRVSNAVLSVSRAAAIQAGRMLGQNATLSAAAASGAPEMAARVAAARELSRRLKDLSALERSIPALKRQPLTRLKEGIDSFIQRNTSAKGRIFAHPNFDGTESLPAAHAMAEEREIAQLRSGPGGIDLQGSDFARSGSRQVSGAERTLNSSGASEASTFGGPVNPVPENLVEPLTAGPSAGNSTQQTSGSKPMPAPRMVSSSYETVGDTLRHAVTHSYPGMPGSDPIQAVADYVNHYIKDQSLPNSAKHLILKYYEMNDPRLYAAIQKAVTARIRVTIITDLNEYLVGNFSGKANATWDFETAAYKKSTGGAFIERLRQNLGFSYKANGGLFTILSGVPLFNPENNRENPIMHDKVAIALGPGGKAYPLAIVGTANLSQVEAKSSGPWPSYGGRYNRFFWVSDPVAVQVDWEHALAEEQAYSLRLGSKGLSKMDHSPVRVVYRDGTYQEIAFTDGIQNPNDRITDLLTRAADPKSGVRINEIVFSHFVLTATGQVKALRNLMAADPALKIFGVFDQMFIPLNSYGMAGALANFLVQRPMGSPIFPFKTAYDSRMTLYGYQRLLDSTKSEPPSNGDDGDPAGIHLWHDKTTLIKTTETNPRTGKPVDYAYVFTRTLNDSNHYENLESQVMIKMLASAPLAQEIENSIKLTVQSEPQYALDLTTAIVRDFIGRFTGRSAYDVDPKDAQGLMSSLTQCDYRAVSAMLSPAGGSSAIKSNAKRLIAFLNWYAGERKKDKTLNSLGYHDAVNIGVGLSQKNPTHMAAALELLYYNHKNSQARQQTLMRKAWTQGLKMKASFPADNAPPGQGQTPAGGAKKSGVSRS
ncbi:MAG: phospholipase D-like domain-containing protein [Elusimicrobiota bacterium]